MTLDEFNSIFKKIEETFGVQHYPPTRKKLFWDEFHHETKEDFVAASESLIKNKKFAPMGEEIRLEISVEKEKKHYQGKKFFSSFVDLPASEMLIPDQDRKMLMGEIMRRATGLMPDSEWDSFKTVISQMTSQLNRGACKACRSSGILISKANFVFKCRCGVGKNDRRKYPEATDFIIKQTQIKQ